MYKTKTIPPSVARRTGIMARWVTQLFGFDWYTYILVPSNLPIPSEVWFLFTNMIDSKILTFVQQYVFSINKEDFFSLNKLFVQYSGGGVVHNNCYYGESHTDDDHHQHNHPIGR